jgi:argininosuccinate lyase
VKSRVTERLKEGPAPVVLEQLYGPRLQEEFAVTFPYMTAVNKAHVLMLARQEIIDRAAAAALLQALLALERSGPAAVRLDPRMEDAFFNYEAAVIRRTSPESGGQMHTVRSRNDLSATLIRLRLRDAMLEFVPRLFQARRTALDQAERYADIVMPGYTHLQPAQPVTFGHYLVGVAAALERDTHRIAAVYPGVNQSPLGAGALAGTTFPIDRQFTSGLLGFDGLVEHTRDAVASRDFALELLAQSAIFGLTCSRVAQDFYVWFTHEFRRAR